MSCSRHDNFAGATHGCYECETGWLRVKLQEAERELGQHQERAEKAEEERDMHKSLSVAWGKKFLEADARITKLETLLRKINHAFNAAGCEIDMPEALGGEVLFDVLCEVEASLGQEGSDD